MKKIKIAIMLVAFTLICGCGKNKENTESKTKNADIISVEVAYMLDENTTVELIVSEDNPFITRKTLKKTEPEKVYEEENDVEKEKTETDFPEIKNPSEKDTKTVYYTYNYYSDITRYVFHNVLEDEKVIRADYKEEPSLEKKWRLYITTDDNSYALFGYDDYPEYWYGLLTVFRESYMYEQENVKDRNYTKMMYTHLGEEGREILRIYYQHADEYVKEHKGIEDGDICVNLFADDPYAVASYRFFISQFDYNRYDSNGSDVYSLKKMKKVPKFDYELKLKDYNTLYLIENTENEFGYDFYIKADVNHRSECFKVEISENNESDDYNTLKTEWNQIKQWITVPCIEPHKKKETMDDNPVKVEEP